jgi:hypothetical protein
VQVQVQVQVLQVQVLLQAVLDVEGQHLEAEGRAVEERVGPLPGQYWSAV